MANLNDIIEWQDYGSEFRLYVKHYLDEKEKVCLQIVFEDATHDKVTEINIPNTKLKQFIHQVNGNLLTRKYEINV
ncbi:MAG: hypothetical protein H6755_03845 [Candidatus Omnitrophica bacterium]|nr:hypothetical protein [Candidatus Omnitrophota bacterium]MCB9747522.1 hypothetical protein [Candidatus Omnitrophota bacterium]